MKTTKRIIFLLVCVTLLLALLPAAPGSATLFTSPLKSPLNPPFRPTPTGFHPCPGWIPAPSLYAKMTPAPASKVHGFFITLGR